MPRTESQEFEYPPGLGSMRSPRGGDGSEQQQIRLGMGSYGSSSQDRRPSSGYTSYGGYGAVPRSLGLDEREYGFGVGELSSSGVPNRHNPSALHAQPSFSSFNHYPRDTLHQQRDRDLPRDLHRAPPSAASSTLYTSATGLPDRDSPLFRPTLQHSQHVSAPVAPLLTSGTASARSTLWWGELEPWMDEEYAKQVCSLMGWDPLYITVPHPAPDSLTGQQANNPGYCFLTFPTPAHAASVLQQISNGGKGAGVTMPNSSKPFVLNWAAAVNAPSPVSASFPTSANGVYTGAAQQYPKEYSIFVGDLAPETSNSDLVAVFRNPVLGLRNDREPKFIRPFLSCKSAKIMLDPVTGVSRGYGFVRFTDEADQQRALIEMHGLYCLSRPMRISPATAKFKPPQSISPLDLPQIQFGGGSAPNSNGIEQSQPVCIALPLPSSSQTKSVSAPIAATSSPSSLASNGFPTSTSNSSIATSSSNNTMNSSTTTSDSSSSPFSPLSPEDMLHLPNNVLAQIAQQYANGDSGPIKLNNGTSITASIAHDPHVRAALSQVNSEGLPRYQISEESWKHHAQARAILGNMIGPNGEQLTSTDPYNTTVFVGGLSPLISEETLRTFFAPFGDIHYVKVPVGKHCGFVQFVKKADAERAIEKMQGFPVGGSRIRLSWGRSQYKAAQAAAQAAQAAAVQTQYVPPLPSVNSNTLSQEQAMQLLQRFTYEGHNSMIPEVGHEGYLNGIATGIISEPLMKRHSQEFPVTSYMSRPELHRNASSFSPFSPESNAFSNSDILKRQDSTSFHPTRTETLPHPSKAYAPGFYPAMSLQTLDLKVNGNASSNATNPTKLSPTNATRPPSASRYGPYLESSDSQGVPYRRSDESAISRPGSGQMHKSHGEHQEFDAMHDLNGTLASLDLDRPLHSESVGKNSSPMGRHFRRTPTPQ
ncbi:hypothetical protein BDQ12DRAFT_201230 [Crucibulum laeve]|uniref:RRM domain-containing protein n=1 Tax=Crucibulum laeve TaxID=68775 RepID=A0A5C3MJ55_9AGAR|nr:hypothetical protein BDQ12DRAFT_201230 [Crucibulum laeve]